MHTNGVAVFAADGGTHVERPVASAPKVGVFSPYQVVNEVHIYRVAVERRAVGHHIQRTRLGGVFHLASEVDVIACAPKCAEPYRVLGVFRHWLHIHTERIACHVAIVEAIHRDAVRLIGCGVTEQHTLPHLDMLRLVHRRHHIDRRGIFGTDILPSRQSVGISEVGDEIVASCLHRIVVAIAAVASRERAKHGYQHHCVCPPPLEHIPFSYTIISLSGSGVTISPSRM